MFMITDKQIKWTLCGAAVVGTTIFLWIVFDAAAISAFSTVALASLTFFYVRLTHRILYEQTRPQIIAHLGEHKKQDRALTTLVLENVGKSTAMTVGIDWYGTDELEANSADFRNALRAQQYGVPSLVPGAIVSVVIGEIETCVLYMRGHNCGVRLNYSSTSGSQKYMDIFPLDPSLLYCGNSNVLRAHVFADGQVDSLLGCKATS